MTTTHAALALRMNASPFFFLMIANWLLGSSAMTNIAQMEHPTNPAKPAYDTKSIFYYALQTLFGAGLLTAPNYKDKNRFSLSPVDSSNCQNLGLSWRSWSSEIGSLLRKKKSLSEFLLRMQRTLMMSPFRSK